VEVCEVILGLENGMMMKKDGGVDLDFRPKHPWYVGFGRWRMLGLEGGGKKMTFFIYFLFLFLYLFNYVNN
jgi:hypothetical protein